MRWGGMGGILLFAALQCGGGCVQDHTSPGDPSSSGSNWLRCEELADCGQTSQAVLCRADGFCVDARGERIAARESAGGAADASVADTGSDAQLSMLPSEGADTGAGFACAWGVDALLRAASVDVPDRQNCGLYWSTTGESSLTGALACFDRARAAEASVQISFNLCVDCWSRSTFVVTETGESFEVSMENDAFGDDQRSARVRSCEALARDPLYQLTCSGPATLYECSEPRRVARELPPDPPVEPFKLADVTNAGGSTLHVYVSNQSFAEPLVDIAVSIDDVQVIIGDFAVEGQHNWHRFDIVVPDGTLEFYAVSFGTAEAYSFSQQIDVPAERWAVLDYWNSPDDAEGPHFTLTVSEVPVSFD